MQRSLQSAGNQVVVVASPLIVQGLQRIGCDVVAATGFIQRLPSLVARHRPDVAVIHAEVRVLDMVIAVLTAVRANAHGLRIVLLLDATADEVSDRRLRALRVNVERSAAPTPELQMLLGIDTPVGTGARPLRDRDVQVLALVAQGLTNRQIAGRLGLAENTIRNYLREVHKKLQVASRTEAVTCAARLGYPVLPTN